MEDFGKGNMNNIAAFLSPYISSAIAVKAMSKTNPKMKEFINRAMTWGYGADQIVQWLRENQSKTGQFEKQLASEEATGTPTPERLIQAQKFSKERQQLSSIPKVAGAIAGTVLQGPYAPVIEGISSMLGGQEQSPAVEQPQQENSGIGNDELHMLIMEHLNQGRNPLEAGAIVGQMADSKKYGHLKSAIKALEKKHNMKFPDIVAKLYQMAMGKPAMPQQQQSQQAPDMSTQGQLGQLGQPQAMPQQAQSKMTVAQAGTPEFDQATANLFNRFNKLRASNK